MNNNPMDAGLSAAREALGRIFGKVIRTVDEKTQPVSQAKPVTFPSATGEYVPKIGTVNLDISSRVPAITRAPATSNPTGSPGGISLPLLPSIQNSNNQPMADSGGTSVPPSPPDSPDRDRQSRDPKQPFWNKKLLLISSLFSVVFWGLVYYSAPWYGKERVLQTMLATGKEQPLVRTVTPTKMEQTATPHITIPHVAGQLPQPATPTQSQPSIWDKPREYLPDCLADSCMQVSGKQTFTRKVHGEQYIGLNAPSGTAYAVKFVGKLNTCASTLTFGETAISQGFGMFVENDRPTDCNAWMTQQRGDTFEILTDGGIVHLHYVMR